MTSGHCKNGYHTICLIVYGGERCDCICHVDLAPRRGWAT